MNMLGQFADAVVNVADTLQAVKHVRALAKRPRPRI